MADGRQGARESRRGNHLTVMKNPLVLTIGDAILSSPGFIANAAKNLALIGSVLVLSSLLQPQEQALACPASLFAMELNPRLVGKRSEIRLFAFAENKTLADPIRVQVDPINQKGRLVFYDNKEPWQNYRLEDLDRIVLRPEFFGRKINIKKDRLPCKGPVVYELESKVETGQFAYITTCPSQAAFEFNQLVEFNTKQSYLESDVYKYFFNRENFMLFDRIELKLPSGTQTVAEKSELLIHSDVKNFFTMSFDSSDIESDLEKTRLGPVSDLAQLSFYLRILFFRIKMALTTDVAFYGDAGHIPMMVQLPVDATKYLNPGSGILYSWLLRGKASTSNIQIKMPMFDQKLVKKGVKTIKERGLTSCQGQFCNYSFDVDMEGKRLAMGFSINRDLVEKGFYPMYVDDVRRYNDSMDCEMELG